MNSGFVGWPIARHNPSAKIGEVIVPPGGQAAATFSAIPQVFRNLRATIQARGDTAGAIAHFARLRMQFNADTGANYYSEQYQVDAGGAGSVTELLGGTFLEVGLLPASGAVANVAGTVSTHILNYSQTTFTKAVIATGYVRDITTTGGPRFELAGGDWNNNTSPISTVTFLIESGLFVAGSVFSLYGED